MSWQAFPKQRNFKLTQKTAMDYTKITDIEFDGIDHSDAPDYCDAYIVKANYNGREMTEEELEFINEDSGFIHEKLMDYLN